MQSFVDQATYTGPKTINMPKEDSIAYSYGQSEYTKPHRDSFLLYGDV